MGIETFVNNQIRNRENRLNSPGFQAEMLREKMEFKDQLKMTGDSALDFVYDGLGKKVMGGAINSAAKVAFNDKYGFSLILNDKWKNYKVFNQEGTNDFLSGNAEDEFRLCLPSIDGRPSDPKGYACLIAISVYKKSAYEKEWNESGTTGGISSASVGTKLGEKNNKVFVSNYLWINEPSDLKDIDSKELKNILSTFQFTK